MAHLSMREGPTRTMGGASISRHAVAQPLQAVHLVPADGVVDHQRVVAAPASDRRRVLADHEPAHHVAGTPDLGVALPVAEGVAGHPAPVAVSVRAAAAAGERPTGKVVAVKVVADPLLRADTRAAVVGAFPPARDVGAGGAAVAALLQLAAERGIAVVAARARGAVAGPDHRPGRPRPHQVADGRHGERRAGDRRPGQGAAARDAPLEQRADRQREALREPAHREPPVQADHARGSSV